MTMNRWKWCVAGGPALLLSCATVAGAQTYQGALRGVVKDIQATEKFFKEVIGVTDFVKMENLQATLKIF